MSSTIGVGILGCGPATQAIHMPTLERLPQFRVVQVMDVQSVVAERVARRVESSWTTNAEDVLSDDAVEAVLICSPHRFHAAQVIAACRARKKAVLCEKPLAMNVVEAREIARVSQQTGVPVVVGAMHAFDPAWIAAVERWEDALTDAHTIRYSITLPPNPRFEDFATEVIGRQPAPGTTTFDAEASAAIVARGIMGLAIHDLPLIRRFCPGWESVDILSAQAIRTGGYLIHLRIGARLIRLCGVMTQTLQPQWRLELIGDDAAVDVAFANAYVHAGSGTAVRSRGSTLQRLGPFAENGYVGEWTYISDLVHGDVEPPVVDDLVDDVLFALRIAEAASATAREQFASEGEGQWT